MNQESMVQNYWHPKQMDDHVLNKHILWGCSFQQVDGHIKKSQIVSSLVPISEPYSCCWTIFLLRNVCPWQWLQKFCSIWSPLASRNTRHELRFSQPWTPKPLRTAKKLESYKLSLTSLTITSSFCGDDRHAWGLLRKDNGSQGRSLR